MKFPGGIFTKKREAPARDSKVLPESVRYALTYRKALLGKEEIEDLASNDFGSEATYLAFKSLVEKPEEHKLLMEKFVNGILHAEAAEGKKGVFKSIVQEIVGNNGSIAVEGGKLAQLSRQGFETWREKFKAASIDLSKDSRNVLLMGHAMYTGLDAFVVAFSEAHKKLNIIIPPWISSGKDAIGLVVSFENNVAQVSWLTQPFDTGDAVLVDDTQNTGETLRKVKEYLQQNGIMKVDTLALDQAKSSV